MDKTGALDWKTCPLCGGNLNVASLEQLEGEALINLFHEKDGTVSAEWEGTTEILWDTQKAVAYFDRNCGEFLPEAYQQALAKMLDGK